MTMKKSWVGRSVAAGSLLLLAGCGGGGNSSSTAITPPTVVTTAQEDKFGTMFGTDFRASANSEPAAVNDTDVVAVSLTTEPITIQ